MTQDEVTWVLNTIASEWPDGSFPADTVRVDRDDPQILDTGVRTNEVDLARRNAIAASLSQKPRTPIGTEFDYRVETTVSVRVEALHASEHGQVASKSEFLQLVARARNAIDQARSTPTVPATSSTGRVDYHSAVTGETVTPDLSANKNHYREDFEVRLAGYEEAV